MAESGQHFFEVIGVLHRLQNIPKPYLSSSKHIREDSFGIDEGGALDAGAAIERAVFASAAGVRSHRDLLRGRVKHP